MSKALEDRAEPGSQSPRAQIKWGPRHVDQASQRRRRATVADGKTLAWGQPRGKGRGPKLGAGWPGPGGQHAGLHSGGESITGWRNAVSSVWSRGRGVARGGLVRACMSQQAFSGCPSGLYPESGRKGCRCSKQSGHITTAAFWKEPCGRHKGTWMGLGVPTGGFPCSWQ